ncbi:MAG: DHA1 family multidrug resistance protein-like MFS transporter [Candidatus Azotimanducaceae bacterium]
MVYQYGMQSTNHSTAVFLASSSFVFLNFGLPMQADEMGLGALMIGGAYAVFTGTMLIARPLVGVLLDKFGRRWFFTGAFVFYAVAMFAFAVADGVQGLYLGRFLQGLGAALMWVSARTIVADTTPVQNYGEAMGQLTAISTRGSMIGGFYGFTLLGFLPMQTAWYWAFMGYGVLALIALGWSVFFVKESKPQVVETPTENITYGWREIAANGKLVRALIVVAMAGFATALIEPVYLLLVKHTYDLPPLTLALVFFPAGLVFAFVPRYAGRWADRTGRGRAIATGIVFAAMVGAALPFWPGLVYVAVSYVLFAVGWAVASPALDGLVADLSESGNRGRVIGAKEAAAGFGAALGPLAGGFLYEYYASVAPFLFNGVILFATAILAWWWFGKNEVPSPAGEQG